MAFGASAVFRQMIVDVLGNTAAFDLSGTPDVFKAALYGNTITPDKDTTAILSAYNGAASQWVVAGEVSDTTHWPAGGIAIPTPAVTTPSSGVVMFDGGDVPSVDSAATLPNVYGCLVYDDTLAAPVADQGVSFHYFGGAQSVAGGSFTIVWHANGLFRATV